MDPPGETRETAFALKEQNNGNGDTKLVSYCNVNVGFDEESPVVRFARRESLQSEKNLKLNSNSNNKIEHHDENGFKVPQRPARSIVKIRNATKKYSNNGPMVLNNFGMTVTQGTIYSLLGSSGCGKTTVLTSILGMRQIKSGSIKVFGESPNPSNRVGYMPQEIALYGDFSIDETLRYYGALCGMSREEIKTSRDFLMPFLDLPDETRRVGTLSCGQQRRVSMAIAILHSPELLILDEPTVGVDALLREKIWAYLVKLVEQKKTSIIVTTHYIEEARQSNMIGLMRGGRLLEENNPTTLMEQHNALLLEDIVLSLCRNDKFGDGEYCYSTTYKKEQLEEEIEREKIDQYRYQSRRASSIKHHSWVTEQDVIRPNGQVQNSLTRIKALTMKNVFVMMRNFLLVLFMIMVPSMLVALVCVGIGNDPRPMRLGVVNLESNQSQCHEYIYGPKGDDGTYSVHPEDKEGCDVFYFSCRFLDKLPKDVIHLIEYENTEDAVQSVLDGTSWGYLSFPENYSDNVYIRATGGNVIDDEALDGSFISYRLDMTNKQISGTLKRIFYDSYKDFLIQMMEECGFNSKLGESPVRSLGAIYGDEDTSFRQFIAPSLLMGVLFFFPLCSSSVQYILDKKQGTLERARVTGVATGEIMMAFFITEGIVLLIQSLLTLIIISVIFGIEIKGSFILVLILTISMGMGGVSMGFVIASFCSEEIQAVLLAMASFFPNFLLSGLIWPTQGMPIALQYISYLLPCTFAAESVRSIISRGWGFTHNNVWPGFLTSFAWIGVYWMITIFIHKIVLSRK